MVIWHSFSEQLLQTSLLEFTAVATGILSVWFGRQEKIWVYPIGIVSVTCYIYITFQYKLYADAAINLYYLVMSVYGWRHWKNTPSATGQIPITESSRREQIFHIALLVFSFFALWLILSRLTDSDVPAWDALTTGFAVTAMYLMALKRIEHWYYWIGCDMLSVPLYIYKELLFTSFQFLIFTYLAFSGLFSWKKKLKLRTVQY